MYKITYVRLTDTDLNVRHLHYYTCAISNISQTKNPHIYIGGNLWTDMMQWLILMLESLSCGSW